MADLERQAADLRFNILRNALYHTARSQFFDLLTRIFNFAVIVLGTSAAAELGHDAWNVDPKYLAAGAVLAATFQLVGDFAVSARIHAYLQRRCYELLAEMERAGASLNEEKLLDIQAKLTTVYGEEPPTMRALDAIAFNEACDSLGKDGLLRIGFLESLLRNFCPFNGKSFKDASKKPS